MRVVFFIFLLIAAVVAPWWLLLLASIVYVCLYDASELVCIGFALDVFFGQPLPWLPVPVFYTACAVLLVGLAEVIKPWLFWYQESSG